MSAPEAFGNSGPPAAATDTFRDASGRFQKGNPGRPVGTRHRITKATTELLNASAGAIMERVIQLALQGDVGALRICMDRLHPAPKGRTVHIDLPALKTARDALEAKARVVEVAAAGEIDLEQAGELARLVDGYAEAHRLIALEERLATLEARLAQREPT